MKKKKEKGKEMNKRKRTGRRVIEDKGINISTHE
jgi:hypothetical protein